MGDRTSYAPGTFSWADLATTDVAGAKGFYGGLLGWEHEDMPVPDAPPYTMFKLNGKEICAAFEQGEEERGRGVPPHWNSYVTVESVDDTASRARDLGGSVLAEPFDVMEAGRMTAFQDPTGATLCAWEPRASIGASLVNDPGAMTWNELATRDVDAARDFYRGLFGWEYETDETGYYTTIRNDGRMNGGIRPQTEQEAGIPPNWIVYFTVQSAEEAGRRAEEAGGRRLVPATAVGAGTFSVVSDPQGAVFALFEGETEE
jgi:predicted enzyme related to lactoylglutathione lyase